MLISPVVPTNCIYRLSNPGKPSSHDSLLAPNNDALTNLKNALTLEILSHQLPEGPQLQILRKALHGCRDRSKGLA